MKYMSSRWDFFNFSIQFTRDFPRVTEALAEAHVLLLKHIIPSGILAVIELSVKKIEIAKNISHTFRTKIANPNPIFHKHLHIRPQAIAGIVPWLFQYFPA